MWYYVTYVRNRYILILETGIDAILETDIDAMLEIDINIYISIASIYDSWIIVVVVDGLS